MAMSLLLAMSMLATIGGQFEAVGHQSTNVFNLGQGSGIPYEGADVIVQAGNSRPKFQFVPSSSFPVVADIRMGASFGGAIGDLPNLNTWMPNIMELGIWRFDTCVEEGEPPINWEFNNEEEFPEEYDQFLEGLNENGIVVDYMLHFWDKTGHANGEELSAPRFQTEDQIQDFLNYTRFVVSHLKGWAQYYTIWSEPDACPGIKCIKPEDYINLVRRTVPVIHEEDPQAKVSIAPNVLYYAREYLSEILESDIMTMVDVVQWHGIYNVFPNDSIYGDYYYQYPAIVEGIRETAAAHGFVGEYWATEITYWSQEFPDCSDQPWLLPESEKQAAKYNSRAVVTHLGMDMGVFMNALRYDNPELRPWCIRAISNLYKVLAGSSPTSLVVDIESEPANTVNNAFELSDGNTLFAFWTNGEAVADDPGVGTTLTFSGLSAEQVVAIDVLNGFEQELIFEEEDGDLIIPDIFVFDYPILLRIVHENSLVPIALVGGAAIVAIVLVIFMIRRQSKTKTSI